MDTWKFNYIEETKSQDQPHRAQDHKATQTLEIDKK